MIKDVLLTPLLSRSAWRLQFASSAGKSDWQSDLPVRYDGHP
jgi:hypothetical protein